MITKLRLARYSGSQELASASFENTASDDVTNMSEIVKRFFNNEPIPQMNEEEVYQYEDRVSLDEKGQPILDEKGNIITEDVLRDEVLNLIPITPNMDFVERSDEEDINSLYKSASDTARAVVRQKRIELERQNSEKLASKNAELQQFAKDNGYVKQTEKTVE